MPDGTAITPEPLLSVSDLAVSFIGNGRRAEVVHGISFDVAPAETVAIVGGSGSGKSVTAMSVMRLLPERGAEIRGQIRLGGQDILSLSERRMQEIRGNEVAMIFQEPMTSLNPVLTVGFQIAEALRLHRNMARRDAEAEALRLIEKVRIPAGRSRFHEYPHRLSGGMRQRVMIAMALACRPKLLIADEPTTALDVTIQAEILELMRLLQEEERMAILFITHDMGVVAEIADRTIVMHNGRVVETGETSAIFAHAEHAYTRSLLAAVPQLGSMAGHDRPMRFPEIDMATGKAEAPTEIPDTVAEAARPVLEIGGLTTRFDIHSGLFRRLIGRVHAVENVSFSLQAGETLALVGESGCGKSTIGRSIMRLVEPSSGAITIDGIDVLDASPGTLRGMRKRVQMVFQDPFASLNPRITVGDAIAAPLLINGVAGAAEARRKVAELLVQVGLTANMARRFPHEFSGGQRQRICIARALALEPQIIVADEAVSALDVSVKTQILNLMLDLQARLKLSYLFISHDMAVVERVAHRVAVMRLGEIVEIGPRAAVFANPQHPYTRKLMSAVPVPDPARRRHRPGLSANEIKSPVRPLDYVLPQQRYREVSPAHVVQIWDEESDEDRESEEGRPALAASPA